VLTIAFGSPQMRANTVSTLIEIGAMNFHPFYLN
jgi:hypothetical protein